MYNETETCRKYMIYQAQKMYKKLGRSPTWREYTSVIGHTSIATYFGNFNKILLAAGLPINKSNGIGERKYDYLEDMK